MENSVAVEAGPVENTVAVEAGPVENSVAVAGLKHPQIVDGGPGVRRKESSTPDDAVVVDSGIWSVEMVVP